MTSYVVGLRVGRTVTVVDNARLILWLLSLPVSVIGLNQGGLVTPWRKL